MHKVYLYRDIWKGIETCQHQKARQHFIACKSEQEHSCQLWSSAGNKPLLPVSLTHHLLFHTETSLFTAFILVFNGMNGDSTVLVSGFLQRLEAAEPRQGAGGALVPRTDTFNKEGDEIHLGSQPVCLHLHGPTLQTLRRDTGMQAQRKTEQGRCCFIFI